MAGIVRRYPLDAALALCLFVLCELEVAVNGDIENRLAAALLAAPMTLALAFRRRYPIGAVAVSLGAFALQGVFGVSSNAEVAPSVVWIVGCYTISAHNELRRAVAGFAVPVIAAAVLIPTTKDSGAADALFIIVVLTITPWVVGRIMRVTILRNRQLARDAARAEAEAEARSREVLERERQRIARELHDIIAHGLSLMVLQAGAAEQIVRVSPERAVEPLQTIQKTGRDALVEMKHLLEVLRTPDGPAELAPQPGLDDLPTLVSGLRDSGLDVEYHTDGPSVIAPDGVALSAYRVVQEALTNVAKHAPGSHADVVVHTNPRWLEIEVCDDGGQHVSATDVRDAGGGNGLVGMRERVALYGGQFEAGQRDGSFRVWARFPLEAT